MSQKTFCDKCGEQCINTVVYLNGAIRHQTSQGEQVGYEDIKGAELCKDCFEPIRKSLGLVVRPQEMDSEMAVMARPVPPPLMVSEVP